MPRTLSLTIEVAGCPTTCQHCWARGRHYKDMHLKDIERILRDFHDSCSKNNLIFSAYPMHEVLAHEDAAEVVSLFREYSKEINSEGIFEPIPTTGVPIATRDDWKEVLSKIHDLGTKTLWFTLHGLSETHNKIVHRKGAHTETCLAIQKAHSVGLRCGCNVFITEANLYHFDKFLNELDKLKLEAVSFEVARYEPTSRGRKYNSIRPSMDNILPYWKDIRGLTAFWKEKWENLEDYSEASFVQKALGATSEDEWTYPENPGFIDLLCSNNFNVYKTQGYYGGTLLGNVKVDSVQEIVGKAITNGVLNRDTLYFLTTTFPSINELARKNGDHKGRKIYFEAQSMRYRWLDLALEQYRKY